MKYLVMELMRKPNLWLNIQESLQGVSFDFVTPFGTYRVKSPYVGKFNTNIMAAMIAV